MHDINGSSLLPCVILQKTDDVFAILAFSQLFRPHRSRRARSYAYPYPYAIRSIPEKDGNAYLCRLENKSSPLKRKNVTGNNVANNWEVSRQKKVAKTQSVLSKLRLSPAFFLALCGCSDGIVRFSSGRGLK